MKPDDPMLMAYADGQLDAGAAARVEAAMAADPALAEAVARHRALSATLRQAYAPVLAEPVPPALLAAARGPAVASLDAARAARTPRWRTPALGWAMAAALALGLAVGLFAGRPAPGPLDLAAPGGVLAAGPLAEALETQLSAESTEAVAISLSFRDPDGTWCRGFRLGGDAPLAGLACRDGQGRWRVPVLSEAPAAAGDLRQAASSLPPAVLAAVDARLAGEALDAEAERRARDDGWR